jgi:hypothetical protein
MLQMRCERKSYLSISAALAYEGSGRYLDPPVLLEKTMNERLHVLQRQPRRISITLSYHVHEALLNRSEEEGRSVSNLCAFLLEEALRHEGFRLTPPATAQPLAQPVTGNGHKVIHPRLQSSGLPPQKSDR